VVPERSAAPLRTAIIGCGGISHEHLHHLAGSGWSDLVSVCDRSEATARFVAELYGAATHHTDAREMLRQTSPDVVHVLTPPQTHVEIVTMALDAGAHVICEKPIAPTAEAAKTLFALAEHRDRHLVETRNLLYNAPVRAIDRLVERGELGQIREIDVHLCLDLADGPFGDLNLEGPGVALPAGAVHDFLPHLSYLFLHFAGEPATIDEVDGRLDNLGGNPRVGFDHLDAFARSGAVRGHLRITPDSAPPSFHLVVRGTAGSAETDLYQRYLRVRRAADTGTRAPVEQMVSGLRLAASSMSNLAAKMLRRGSYEGVARMLDDIYRSLVEGGPLPISEASVLAGAALTDQLAALASNAPSGAFES
jgi:predicted dehydrogenase